MILLAWVAIDQYKDPHYCFSISGEVMLVRRFSKLFKLYCQLKRNIYSFVEIVSIEIYVSICR